MPFEDPVRLQRRLKVITSVLAIVFISAGLTNPPDGGLEVLGRLEPERNLYRKLVLKRGRLVGYVLVGEVRRAGLLTGLIRDAVDVGGFREKLLSSGLGYLDLPEELRRSRLT